MKERISALMDGELDEHAAGVVIEALAGDREARQAWRTYHLIGDALRERGLRAPRPVRFPRFFPQRFALAAAATLAAVALVGWLAFAPQPPVAPAPIAQAPTPAATVPLPSEANDYLLAHQGFSPRVSFQGMAPYVRTVAEHREEPVQ